MDGSLLLMFLLFCMLFDQEGEIPISFNYEWLFQPSNSEGLPFEPLPAKKKRTKRKKIGCARKRGRKTVEEKFPEIPTVLTDVLQERGWDAQRSRAVPTGQSGLTLQECRDGLLRNVPTLSNEYPAFRKYLQPYNLFAGLNINA